MSGRSQDSVAMTISGSILASRVCNSVDLLTTDWQFITTIFRCRGLGWSLGFFLAAGLSGCVLRGVEVASGAPMELGVFVDWVEAVDWVRDNLGREGVWMESTSG